MRNDDKTDLLYSAIITGLKLKTDELKSVYKSADVVLVCCVTSLCITTLIPGYIVHQVSKYLLLQVYLLLVRTDDIKNSSSKFGSDFAKTCYNSMQLSKH